MAYRVQAPESVDGPMTGDDEPMLRSYLDWQRSTLLAICAGLTGEQLASRPVESSELTLLGLIRHLAKVERIWFRQRAMGEDVEPLHGGAGDPADFAGGEPADAEPAVTALQQEWAACDKAIAGVAWTHQIEVHGEAMSLRMIYLHLIGEYARHNGHADLLREAIDGVTGR